MDRRTLLVSLATSVGTIALAGPVKAETQPVRGLWIWEGRDMVASKSAQTKLLTEAATLKLTEIYLALARSDYHEVTAKLAAFITRMSAAGIKVWALDGSRGFFSDADGPAQLYAHVDMVVAYNDKVPEAARFCGFQTDNEPQDLPDFPAHFHSGLADSQLTPVQAAEREALLLDWLNIQTRVYETLKSNGLRTGAAMVFFTEDHYGEPLRIAYNGVRSHIGQLMMGATDDFIVMSYNTDPANAASRVSAQAAFASRLSAEVRPRVIAAMETNPRVGATVSYADTPGKQSKAAVLVDMAIISQHLEIYPAFAGVSVHAWRGWQALS
jgi:hypothetical protein